MKILTLLILIFSSLISDEVNTEKRFETIEANIENLKSKTFKKNHIVVSDDIEFLYDNYLNGSYTFKKLNCLNGNSIAIDDGIGTFGDRLICINKEGLETNELEFENLVEYKLLAIEESQKIKTSDKTKVERISSLYKRLNFNDWEDDRIKFIVTLNNIEELDEVLPSFGLMVFPSYRKYMPGNFDLLRRTAAYVTIGNSANSDSQVYSTGLNFEIQNGVGINIGYSMFNINGESKDSVTAGITLSTDLWKSLF